jgi:ATP-binding cassette subfamily F protein 3
MIIEDDNTILSYLCNGMDTLDSLEQRLMNLSDSLAQNPDNKKYQDEFDSTMCVDFDEIPHSGRDVLILEDVQVGYENLVLIEQANFILNFGERVALIGENGSGKTSLIKTILGETPALAGTYRLGSQVKIGYMSQEQNQFDPDKSVLDSIGKFMSQNETENRSFLSKFLFKGDDVFKTIGSLSYGERARLSLACLVAEGCNFLILDEPINHLDIPSRTQFEKALSEFIGTILAVVHDRYFIDGYASQIWEIKEKRLLVRERMLPQTFG